MKLNKFKDWSIFAKITSLSVVGVIPFILLFFVFIMPSVEDQLFEEKKLQLKDNVDVAYSIIREYETLQNSGELSSEKAKEEALKRINALRYDGENYFWINDLEPRMIMHPIKHQLDGKPLADNKDPNGKHIFVEMVKVVKTEGDGFVDYYWTRQGYSEPVHKISYVKLHEEWGWVIGTGVYVNDLEEVISFLYSEMYLFLFIAIGISLLAGYLIANRISKPVKALNRSVSKIADGNLNASIEAYDSGDEVGILSRSINEMARNTLAKIFWYEQLLDAIPFPISVTDTNMNWTFINKATETVINKTRKDVIGKHCSNWGADICDTERCGVTCLKKGENTSFFTQPGLDMDFQVDTAYVHNVQGEKVGHIEIVQDITKMSRMQKYLETSTQILLREMDKFSNGDLTVNVKAENENDDIGKLFTGFNKSVENIRAMINQVLEAVQATASASNQISASTEEMAAGAQEQSSQTTEIASAVEEMTATIIETTTNASSAANTSKEAGGKAKVGATKVEETKQGMNDIVASAQGTAAIISSLANKTDQIGEIAQTIDDIADQTNLLALNAAIEAARAGEQGRGFAVVADEVRKLAERTTKATKEIAETIKDIQREAKEADESMQVAGKVVGRGQQLTEEVAVSLNEILDGSQNVVDIISQVASASEQQSVAAEQISRNVESISSVANESASGIQQIARASEDLNRLTENLQELVSRFKLNSSGHSDFSVRKNGVLVHD